MTPTRAGVLAHRLERQFLGAERAADAAGAAGDLVSIFTFRGAVHHVAVEQAGAWLALRGAGRQWERKRWREAYRLEPEDWPALGEAVRGALADGPLTPKELGAALAAYSALRPAVSRGSGLVLVCGVVRGTWRLTGGDVEVAPAEGWCSRTRRSPPRSRA